MVVPRLHVLDYPSPQWCAHLVITAHPQTDALSDQTDLWTKLAALVLLEMGEKFCTLHFIIVQSRSQGSVQTYFISASGQLGKCVYLGLQLTWHCLVCFLTATNYRIISPSHGRKHRQLVINKSLKKVWKSFTFPKKTFKVPVLPST